MAAPPPLDPQTDPQAFLAPLRSRISSPSPRNLNRSRHSNPPDLIESHLQLDGHRTWGFVIYRTTYDSEADWNEFLRRLRFRMEEEFEECDGRDVLELFTCTVFDERERFEGWDSSRSPALEQQRQSPSESGGAVPVMAGKSPRYRFAIQVDAPSLHSVIYSAPPTELPDATRKGWVRLINGALQPYQPNNQSLQADLGAGRSLSMALPASTADRVEYTPIEGTTEKNVGWMGVPYQAVMSDTYILTRDANWWVRSYCRPPTVLGWPYDDY